MADRTAHIWFKVGEQLQSTGRDAEALSAYEQALRLAPSNDLAFRILELQRKLHRPQAPGGHLSADVLNHDRNGSRYASPAWREPASFQGSILAGQQGRYQVLQRLRDTLLTTSYHARDLANDRSVLVKVLYPRVLVYLATIAPGRLGLSDPHLEQLLGYGVEGTCCYLVTEDLEGSTLQEQMALETPCAVERAVELAVQMAQGLEALWQAGITDGALEPATFVLGGEQGLKLTDLGLHVAWGQVRAQVPINSEPVVGNFAYCPPETTIGLPGAPDRRADLYALAGIFFELLSGHPPYPGKTLLEVVMQHGRNPIPSICALRPDLAPSFDTFFEKALTKQPDDGYQTPQALLQALTDLTRRS